MIIKPKPKTILPVRLRTGARLLHSAPSAMAVRFRTQLCDAKGHVIRDLQDGANMITDFGMDQRQSASFPNFTLLFDHLHLGSSTQTMKRIATGEELTIDYSGGPADLDISTDTNFFEAGDVGRSLKIDGFPEILIDGFTDAQNVHGTARAGVWLPGFDPDTPGGGPHTDFGMHYTNTPTLAAQFTKFNTKDTGSANNDASLVDSSNSRFIDQKIWLSAVVSGSPWTVNQLGWSDNNGSNNCMGKVNLASPDTVPVGNRYRVTMQVLSTHTPINLSAVAVDWGVDIGSYTVDIQQERVGNDKKNANTVGGGSLRQWNAINPAQIGSLPGGGYWTDALSLTGVQWDGDAGFTSLNSRVETNDSSAGYVQEGSYTNGDFRRTRGFRWIDTLGITNATALYIGQRDSVSLHYPALSVRPTTGTISKPSGFWAQLNFMLYWTRELVN